MSELPDYMKPLVRIVSAPCSTGKTYAACQYIAENQHITNHIYIAPTLELLNQSAAMLRAHGIRPKLISSDTNPNNAKRAILDYLEEETPGYWGRAFDHVASVR